jgi:hypothetical protein
MSDISLPLEQLEAATLTNGECIISLTTKHPRILMLRISKDQYDISEMQVFGLQRPHEWPHSDISGSHFIQRVLQREEAAVKSLVCYAWGDETRTKGCMPCRLLSAPCVILRGYFEDFCSRCLDTGEQCNG